MRCGTWEIQLIIMLYLYPLNNGRGSNKGEIMDYLKGKGLTVGGGQAECVLINLYEEMKYIDMNTRSATTGMASGASAAASATTGGEGMATDATGGEETASCLWEGRHYHDYRNGKGGIVIVEVLFLVSKVYSSISSRDIFCQDIFSGSKFL